MCWDMMVDLPSGWERVRVDEICELGRGRVISQIEIDEHPGIYPVYSSQTADEGIMGYLYTHDFEGEYVTWTTDGANAGTVFYRSGKFNCTNVCGTLKGFPQRIDMRFLAATLSLRTKRFVSYIGNPKLMNNVIAAIRLRIPLDVNEQRRITEILDTIDQTIRQTEELIAKLKQMKQGLLHDLLTRGLDANGQLRDSIAHPEQFKDSPLGRIPREWEVFTLGSLAESAIDGPFGSNLKTEHYISQPGVRVVRLQNIGNGYFDDADKAYISEEHARFLKRHQVFAGDLLIASMGDDNNLIARACLYPSSSNPGINKADCFRFRLKPSLAIHGYVVHVLNCPSTREDIDQFRQGVTRDRVNLTMVQQIKLRTPPIPEQVRIVEILDSHNERIQAEEAYRDKLKLQKKGLMHDLLTGRVRVG